MTDHENDSYGGCVICREWVPQTDDVTIVVPWPCPTLRLAALDKRYRDALQGLLIAVDNAGFDALLDAEDGAEEPEWQTRLWDAADEARAALAALEDLE